MTKSLFSLSIAAAALVLVGCSPSGPNDQLSAGASTTVHNATQGEVSCDELAGILSYCGFKNPEDLAVIPGGEFLLVSEMGAISCLLSIMVTSRLNFSN